MRIVSEVISTKRSENTGSAIYLKECSWKICLIKWHCPFNLSVFRVSDDYLNVLCFDQGCGSASFNADLNPDFYFNADPDPAPHQSDGNLRRPSMALFRASKSFLNLDFHPKAEPAGPSAEILYLSMGLWGVGIGLSTARQAIPCRFLGSIKVQKLGLVFQK